MRVTIVRGAGPCFSSGYDLGSALWDDKPFWSAGGDGKWSRHVSEGWFGLWDLAKPVIAQVHGYALAGGTELMAACDLAYVAADAQIGYPVTRIISPPDMQFHPWLVGMRNAMELLLTGDSISGDEAARIGLCNRAFPPDELEAAVLAVAEKVAKVLVRSAAAQQAIGAPRDGHHGRAGRDPRGLRAPGARRAPGVGRGTARPRAVEHEGRGRQARRTSAGRSLHDQDDQDEDEQDDDGSDPEMHVGLVPRSHLTQPDASRRR